MLTLARATTSVIAMDIGTCSLRAVQLIRAGSRWRVFHWMNVESVPTSAQPDLPNYLDHLGLAFGPGSFAGSRAALLIGPPHAEYRLLEVPAALLQNPAVDLRTALQFELDRQLPWPSSESEVALWPARETVGKQAGIMTVCARTQAIDSQLEMLDAHGCECTQVTVLPDAILPICSPAGAGITTREQPLWGVLDIGFASARLYLIHAGRCVYARVIGGGGNEFTSAISEALHVDYPAAEQYKRKYGLVRSNRGLRASSAGLGRISEQALPSVLFAIVRPVLESMTSEIERAFQYAMTQCSAGSGGLYVVGGGSRCKGLSGILAADLGLEVKTPDVPETLLAADGTKPEHPACGPGEFAVLAPCFGLAMGGRE